MAVGSGQHAQRNIVSIVLLQIQKQIHTRCNAIQIVQIASSSCLQVCVHCTKYALIDLASLQRIRDYGGLVLVLLVMEGKIDLAIHSLSSSSSSIFDQSATLQQNLCVRQNVDC